LEKRTRARRNGECHMAMTSVSEDLRAFLDEHITRHSLMGRVARGENLNETKYTAAIKLTAMYFSGRRQDPEIHALIRGEYEKRRSDAAAREQLRGQTL
jgi:hypothetical protein